MSFHLRGSPGDVLSMTVTVVDFGSALDMSYVVDVVLALTRGTV